MSNTAPERIWAFQELDDHDPRCVHKFWISNPEKVTGEETEYVRADLLATARADALEEAATRMDTASQVMSRLGSYREVKTFQNAAKSIRALTDQEGAA